MTESLRRLVCRLHRRSMRYLAGSVFSAGERESRVREWLGGRDRLHGSQRCGVFVCMCVAGMTLEARRSVVVPPRSAFSFYPPPFASFLISFFPSSEWLVCVACVRALFWSAEFRIATVFLCLAYQESFACSACTITPGSRSAACLLAYLHAFSCWFSLSPPCLSAVCLFFPVSWAHKRKYETKRASGEKLADGVGRTASL